jgi:hypothetical protein
MAENPGDSSGDSEQGRSDANKPHGSKAVTSNLPMVVAPKLGAGEDEAIDETAAESADEGATSAAPANSNSTRFLALAASVAFAAAFGSFVGSVSGSSFAHYVAPGEQAAGVANTTDAMRDLKLELADLSSIKMDLDTATRSTTSQLGKLSDRLDRLDQHTAAAASDITGSIASAPAPASDPPKFTDRILQDWVVQDVQGGRALVENRYGGVFEVGNGSTLPGVGRVDEIKRQDGQWMVLTERGTIMSGR